MKVVIIMLLALVGSVSLIILCQCSRWSFIYLIRYRFLKMEIMQERYELNAKHDILSIIIVTLTLAAVTLLLIYGIPIVLENSDFFQIC